MKGWVTQRAMSSDLGSGPGWIAIQFAVQASISPVHILYLSGFTRTFDPPAFDPALTLNLRLLLGLGASFAIWALLLALRRVPAWTGTGFVLAGYGLTARSWADLGRAWLHGHPTLPMLDATRTVGLAAYGAGLTLVVATTVLALRHGRPAPAPLPLRETEWSRSRSTTFR